MDDTTADEILARFNGEGPSADDDLDDPAADADNENGRMFREAFKRGDNAALCEAIRRICGV